MRRDERLVFANQLMASLTGGPQGCRREGGRGGALEIRSPDVSSGEMATG